MQLRRDFMAVALSICVAVEGMGQVNANAPAKSASATSANQATRISGTYRYVGNAAEQEARQAAIDRAVEGMSVFIRSTARSRISATTQILESYVFSFEVGKIRVRAQGRPEMISGDKGEPADYVYNGRRSTLTQVRDGDQITQVFVSDDGRRENEFTLSPDGQVMMLKVTLTSPRLSVPVVYRLSYKKVD